MQNCLVVRTSPFHGNNSCISAAFFLRYVRFYCRLQGQQAPLPRFYFNACSKELSTKELIAGQHAKFSQESREGNLTFLEVTNLNRLVSSMLTALLFSSACNVWLIVNDILKQPPKITSCQDIKPSLPYQKI